MISALAHLARLARAGVVFAREGVFGLVDPAQLPMPGRILVRVARLIERPASTIAANRLSAALTHLGPTYVKLGQFLATRPDVVGVALARDLESLQDKMTPFAQGEAERMVAAAFDRPVSETFAAFGPPVAAALSEMAQNTKEDPDFRVPAVDWNRTAHDVLTLEWIDGTPLSDRRRLQAKGFDLKDLGRAVIQTFLRHALRDGYFHADMHPGNLFVDDDGRLVAVDFGIMGRLGPNERRFLAEILYGFITRDYHRTAEVHFEAGYVPRQHSVDSFAQAIRAIGEPIHNRTAEDISMARLLMLLFEVTGLFDMRTRPELILLQKTMVVVEGVARTLDPRLDMWKVADPVVREWIERHLGVTGRIEGVTEGAREVGRFLGNVPSLLGRAAVVMEQLDGITRDGLVLSPETVAALERAQARRNRWTAAALWLIAALLAWLVFRGG